MASSASFSRKTPSEVRRIYAERRRGFYHTDDTLNEAALSLSQMEPSDKVFTLLRAAGQFGMLNQRELLQQILLWRSQEAVCLEKNVRERDLNGTKVWIFVVQPKVLKEEDPSSSICPLAIAFSFMVSGFTYVTKEKAIADLVVRALST